MEKKNNNRNKPEKSDRKKPSKVATDLKQNEGEIPSRISDYPDGNLDEIKPKSGKNNKEDDIQPKGRSMSEATDPKKLPKI